MVARNGSWKMDVTDGYQPLTSIEMQYKTKCRRVDMLSGGADMHLGEGLTCIWGVADMQSVLGKEPCPQFPPDFPYTKPFKCKTLSLQLFG